MSKLLPLLAGLGAAALYMTPAAAVGPVWYRDGMRCERGTSGAVTCIPMRRGYGYGYRYGTNDPRISGNPEDAYDRAYGRRPRGYYGTNDYRRSGNPDDYYDEMTRGRW